MRLRGDALEIGEQRHRARIEKHGRVHLCPSAAPTPARSSRLSGPTYDRVGAVLSLGQDPRWRRAHGVPRPARRRHRARRRNRDRARRRAAARPRPPRDGARPEPRDARRRAAAVRRHASTSSRRRRPISRSRTRPSTTSRSPISSATSTTPPRPSRSWPASSAPAARSRRSSSACPGGSGDRSGTSTSASAYRLPGGLISRGWYEVGRFLGPSIRGFYEQWPLERQLELWREAGIVGRSVPPDEPRRRSRDLRPSPRGRRGG